MTDAVTDMTHGVYRRIYSGFITGQRITKLSLQAEAWFWRVLAVVDDFGNYRAEPELVRDATAGKRTNVTAGQVAKWLREMMDAQLLRTYKVNGEYYLHINGFVELQPAGKNGRRHQRYPFETTSGESGGIRGNPDALKNSSPHHNQDHNHNQDQDQKMSRSATVRQLFEYWQEQLNKPRSQLTPDRKKKIEERLGDSTVEEIKTAIRGCKASDFHMGREPGKPTVHDDIELICRKRSKLEMFIALAPQVNGSRPVKTESEEEKQNRESCLRCFGTGNEVVEGKGARACDHSRQGNGIVGPGEQSIEGVFGDREGWIS